MLLSPPAISWQSSYVSAFFRGDHISVMATGEVVTAALEELEAVHACGLLHGDPCPSNIMVVWPPVRILGFGVAFVTSKKLLKAGALRTSLDTHGEGDRGISLLIQTSSWNLLMNIMCRLSLDCNGCTCCTP